MSVEAIGELMNDGKRLTFLIIDGDKVRNSAASLGQARMIATNLINAGIKEVSICQIIERAERNVVFKPEPDPVVYRGA